MRDWCGSAWRIQRENRWSTRGWSVAVATATATAAAAGASVGRGGGRRVMDSTAVGWGWWRGVMDSNAVGWSGAGAGSGWSLARRAIVIMAGRAPCIRVRGVKVFLIFNLGRISACDQGKMAH